MTILLNTNVVLEHLRSNILSVANTDLSFAISAITIAELLRYPGLTKTEIETIDQFIDICLAIPVDSRIARRAALLGKTRKTKLPDLLIAATALEIDVALITLNLRDFKNIPHLRVRKMP